VIPDPDAADPGASDLGNTQDVRFAVAMSGGVSLAVWMGGVAREVNLLQQASRSRQRDCRPVPDQAVRPGPGGPEGTAGTGANPGREADPGRAASPAGWDAQVRNLYRQLLDCLDITVTVDVLAGTSAGGVNAALLGLSSAAGADLAMLRDLWLKTGSMDLLLRDPSERNPPSLMQGDKVLFTQLAGGIKGFPPAGEAFAPVTPPDTTVFITTTMMSGETSRFTDDYGTVVPDVDHHGLFTFHQNDLAPDPADQSSLDALALAARCSASFPGAFEPSFVPVHQKVTGVTGVPPRPDMADFANMTRSHWVADGGLLANRPIAPLLSTVFSRRATREVRRVLAYVVPDGGVTAHAGQSPPADQWAKPPTLVQALKRDLDAQLSQSVASELQLIRDHNDQLTAASDLRRALADMGARLPDGLVTPALLVDYQVQQGRGLARPLLAEILRAVSALDRLPEGWDTALQPASLTATSPEQQRLTTEMAMLLGAGWNPAVLAAGPIPAPAGTAGQDQTAGEILCDEAAAWAAWDSSPGSDPVSRAGRFGLPALRGAQGTVMHLIRLGYQRAVDPGQRQMLDRHHAAVTAALQGLPAALDDDLGVARTIRAGAEPAGGRPPADLRLLVRGLADQKRRILLIGADSAALAGAWRKLAAEAIDLLRELAPLAVADGRKSRREAAQALATYCQYLGSASDPATMTDRLLNLAIAERALQPAQPVIDQPVEFIQVSANTRTLLSPHQDRVTKLRGVELHHFAAFYKSSWRAYDWMWGRLDGSGWLVHILLDPRRILAVIENRYDWPRPERAGKFAALLRETLGLPAGLPGDCLERDLGFLNDPDATIPVSLPNSALFLARAWQERIAANELPTVAQQMVDDSGQPPKPPDPWVTRVRQANETGSAKDLAALLPACPVRLETLAGEERSPAFLQTATKAAAVATAALTVAPEVPKSIRPILTSARAVTRTGYLATKAIGGKARNILLAGLGLVIVGIVLATQGTVIIGLTGTVLALAGLYLIALGAWDISRGLLGALIAFTALLAVGALALPWVRTELWGKNGSAKDGWVPRDVLPWLRGTWWAGLTVLGGIILLAVLLNFLPRSRAPHNSGQETPTGPQPPVGVNDAAPPPLSGTAAGVDGSPAANQGSPPADRDAALR
jgi:predicted acylesterase/phospholipase RssA